MKTILNVKEYIPSDKYTVLSEINWQFKENTDERVIAAAYRISNDNKGIKACITHKNKSEEKYKLTIEENSILIEAESAAGAFYALITLKKLILNSAGKVQCCAITDYPDMKYRGFYQDTTRGRIPTLKTLKKLADTMAEWKMNSLQLYVEHTFEFKEYEFCRDELGYLTKAEIKELDKYCRDRFIELIPSLSCFGHLYHLLQNEKYKHLCELKNFEQKEHHFIERMQHHTINPMLCESFNLVTGLIEQHMEAFSSNYFNICCDETFDLGTDVNKDKDKGELYIGFVKKLIGFVESKGKTVMMWGDIILEHPKYISELSDNIVFLNWEYEKEPDESKIAALKDKTQIICPGTTSWFGFSERTNIEEDNIIKLAKYGYKYGAIGMLNTNWGDLGNIASIEMAMYGLIIGAQVSWNKNFELNEKTKKSISKYHYGNSEAIEILDIFGEILNESQWRMYLEKRDTEDKKTKRDFKLAAEKCDIAIKRIAEMDFINAEIKNEFTVSAKGYALLVKWCAKRFDRTVKCNVDFKDWLNTYKAAWLKNSKQGELNEVISLFEKAEES